ncbi:MAG TPA: Pr6Pr family membrane protein [Candidatus Nitrosotalea sp.]|nr:Pr6Pr family membrane protein [Candidatus Nitrosotalea sp.]
MDAKLARAWFAGTAACVAVGVSLSVITAIHNTGGYFDSPLARAFNSFAFFTVQSNLIVGVTSGLLAIKPERSSTVFSVFRLTGLVAIVVTGVVYHVALAQLLDLHSWDQMGNQLVHFVVPILVPVGWLLFGPRRLTSARIALWALTFPIFWLVFSLTRGAFQPFYAYPFIDVTKLGYGAVLLNCLWVSILFLGLAGGVTALDGFLARQRTDPAHLAR